ncbi:MAG: acyltransferase family protein [Ilumatobacter sp.]|uniref:acyltransferase family protein n=1 Tax=Ilumatobacter sp. TaxID=1967498 RepID=UPI003C74FBF1
MTATDAAVSRETGPVTRPVRRRAADERGRDQISQLPYLPGLDGIRALAVVAVMVYHANSDWLAGGYLGVEVFFVISGYLITLLLIAEHERTGTIDLKKFWIRRFRRLLPALFVMMLLLSAWVAIFERDALGKLRGDVLAGAFYGSNWYQIWIGAGYSAGNDFAPLRHLWSLAVEEQFYVVWPIVMMAFVRVGSRRIAGIARWLFLAAIAVTVIVAVLNHSGPQQAFEITPDAYWVIGDRPISKPDALYLSTFSRAGGLLLGSAFAMVWRPAAVMRGPLRTKGALFDVAAVLGLAALGLMCWRVGFLPSQGVHGFLFNGGLFATGIATLGVIAAVTHRGAVTGRLLSLPVLVWIGTRSYGLYLYHWPIYQIIRKIAANKLQFHEFVLAMVATAIITELSYRFVETPIREGRFGELLGRRHSGRSRRPMSDRQRKGVMGGAAVATVLTVFAVGSLATAQLQQNSVDQSIDEGRQFTCDALRDIGCDGELDFDEEGNPLTPAGEAALGGEAGDAVFEGGDGETNTPVDGAEVAPDPEPTENADAGAVPGSTAPPTTEAPQPPAARLAVGDSVMLGASKQLSELGFVVDAIESRAWVNGLDAVQKLAQQNRLPEILIIHLGTNSSIGQQGMDDMMAAVADVPQVLLITNEIPTFPDVEAANNAVIIQAEQDYDNVKVLYWGGDGLADDCIGDCFAPDGIHMNIPGREYYASLIAEVLDL